MRSFTWKNNQENHDCETCSSKKYDWWDTFIRNEIKKKAMNNDNNFFKVEENNYFINEEKKLMQNCHFDYQETIQTAEKRQQWKKHKK